jgi:hypothetical protein
MTFFPSPTFPIGRTELNATSEVLRSCTPLRRKQALPYLMALYSFINWWENHAELDFFSDDVVNPEVPGADALPWELALSTVWCERPEIIELINIADLSLQDVRLGVYPANAQDQLLIHCPTLLSMIQADLCVGVRLEAEKQQAAILGFILMADLVDLWQVQPPNPQGFYHLAASALQPPYLLPQAVYQVQVGRAGLPQESQITSSQAAAADRKSNRNFTTSTPTTLTSEKMVQILQKLSAIGVSPFAIQDWDQQTALNILKDPEICQKVLDIHHLIKGFESYGEQATGQSSTTLGDR